MYWTRISFLYNIDIIPVLFLFFKKDLFMLFCPCVCTYVYNLLHHLLHYSMYTLSMDIYTHIQMFITLLDFLSNFSNFSDFTPKNIKHILHIVWEPVTWNFGLSCSPPPCQQFSPSIFYDISGSIWALMQLV